MSRLHKILLAMAIISVLIIVGSSIIGFSVWRNNMTYQIDSTVEYKFNDIDMTDILNYNAITNTYLVGAIFLIFSMYFGFVVDVIMWSVFGFIMAIIRIIKKIKGVK